MPPTCPGCGRRAYPLDMRGHAVGCLHPLAWLMLLYYWRRATGWTAET